MSPPSSDRLRGISVTRGAVRAVLSTQPDARLVELARGGSEGAFEEIVRRYRTALLRYSRSILEEGAEDAVQHGFLNAHQALNRGDDVIDLRPWLYRLTRNAAVDVRRRQGPETSPLDLQIDGVEQPHEALIKREELGDLVTRMGRLPRRQREALVLRELDGRGHEEIAELLGVSGGAVRQLIHRARGTLRSAAAFLTPPGLVERLAGSGSGDHPARVAEIVTGGAGLGTLVIKGGTAVLATSAVVFGGIGAMTVPGSDRDRATAGVSVDESSGRSTRPAPIPLTSGRRSAPAIRNDGTSPAPGAAVSTGSSSAQGRKADPIRRKWRASGQEGEPGAEVPPSEPDHDSDPLEQEADRPAAEVEDPEEPPVDETEPDAPEAPDEDAVSAETDLVGSDETTRSGSAEAADVETPDDEDVDELTD